MRAVRVLFGFVVVVSNAYVAPSSASTVTVSHGEAFALKLRLTRERPTLVMFLPAATAQRGNYVQTAQVMANQVDAVQVCVAVLPSLHCAAAREFGVTSLPLFMVYDRYGRQTARTTDLSAVPEGISRAESVARLAWVTPESDAGRNLYLGMNAGSGPVSDIVKAMSLRPDVMADFVKLSNDLQFTNGYLDAKTKELLGLYVSSINHCKYCISGHAAALLRAGADPRTVLALATDAPDMARLTPRLRLLLQYAEVLTRTPVEVTDWLTTALRKVGWSDGEISEAAMDIALFAFTNRVADAYGLTYPVGGWRPPMHTTNKR